MKILKIVGISLVALGVVCFITVAMVLARFSRDLPSLDAIKNYNPLLVTTVFDSQDKPMAEFSEQTRKTLTLEEMPKNVINAFVAAEDNEFFSHRGINPVTLVRAAFKNMVAGYTVQGGSTITQQVAKSILLTPEKTYSRKIKEMLLAFKIEKAMTKQEIINLYLNHIYLGNNAYGVEGASLIYFGKSAKDITIPEAAILAGLPKAPSRDNPITNPAAAKGRQRYVLGRLLNTGMISRRDYEEYVVAPVAIKNRKLTDGSPAPYFTEHVRRYLMQKYGKDLVYGGGLRVYTTLDLQAQKAAQDAIKVGLREVDRRVGMRAPTKTLPTDKAREDYLRKQHDELIEAFYDFKSLNKDGKLESPSKEDAPSPIELAKNYSAVVVDRAKDKSKTITVKLGNRTGIIKPEDYKWASEANAEEIYKTRAIRNPFTELKNGDVITVQPKVLHPGALDEFFLEQEPMVQGALLSYRVPDGAMVSMVGGYDFNVTKSEFNRATQAQRQPGSTFKPIVYGAALEQGLTPATIIVDSPLVYRDSDEQTQMEKVWRPDNYGDKFYGDTTLRNSLTFSRNIPTIKLLQYLKIPSVIAYARKMGITAKLNEDLSLALGSNALTLDEITHALAIYANQGNRLSTYFIRRIEDRTGKVLEERNTPATENVIPDSQAFLMTSILKNVVQIGSGTKANELGRPVAGKTGTTNDSKDALFIGYVPQMITGVWVGFDEGMPIGRNETGNRAAAPIWLQYMQVATAGLEAKDFEQPSTVTQVQIDAETGDLPTPKTKKRIYEYFADGTAPGQPLLMPGPDGKTMVVAEGQINHTKVVTGNKELMPATGQETGASDPGVNADELIRDEL